MENIVKGESEIIGKINAQSLIAQAIEKGNVEILNKAYDFAIRIKADWAKEQFFIALAKLQKETPTIKKTIQVFSKDGSPRYKYASLETIIEQVKTPLESNGFSYTLKTKQTDKLMTIICEAHHIFGHTEHTEITVPIGDTKFMSAAQEIGTANSYAKRYSFCNSFGIMTGDEDTDAVDDKIEPPPIPEKEKTAAEKEGLELWAAYKKRFADIESKAMLAELKNKSIEDKIQALKDALMKAGPAK